MDKQLAQHRTQEQGSRITATAHLNYEFAMYRCKGRAGFGRDSKAALMEGNGRLLLFQKLLRPEQNSRILLQ
jgi:hypothetical protein